MTPYYQANINSTETISPVNTSISKVDDENNDAAGVSWKKKVAVVISVAVAVVGVGGVGHISMSIEGKLRAPAMTLVNSRSNTAAIVSSVARKTGGCRTTGSYVPYGSYVLYDREDQTFGEPLESLGFMSIADNTGSYQDKNRFDTFDQAWQGCATQCNWDPKCHTYTVKIKKRKNYFVTSCYSHYIYKSAYILFDSFDSIHSIIGVDEWHVGGVCRLN